jgi:hypothetical protein
MSIISGLNATIDRSVHSGGRAQRAESERRTIASLFPKYWREHSEVGSMRFGQANRLGSCAGNGHEKVSSFDFRALSSSGKRARFRGRDVGGRQMNSIGYDGESDIVSRIDQKFRGGGIVAHTADCVPR